MPEQRTHERIPTNAGVTLKARGAGTTCTGVVRNLHVRGISIQCPQAFEVGTIVDIEIITDDGDDSPGEVITAALKISRVAGERPPYEIAGEFIELSLP